MINGTMGVADYYGLPMLYHHVAQGEEGVRVLYQIW